VSHVDLIRITPLEHIFWAEFMIFLNNLFINHFSFTVDFWFWKCDFLFYRRDVLDYFYIVLVDLILLEIKCTIHIIYAKISRIQTTIFK